MKNYIKSLTDFRSVDEVEIISDGIEHTPQEKEHTLENPLQFQTYKEYYLANCLALFHIISPYIFVLLFFFITTYINCLLQIFAQYQVEGENIRKLEQTFARITNLELITSNLTADLKEKIMVEAVNLIPWLSFV